MNLSNIKFMSYIEIYNEVTTSYKEKYGIDKMNDLLEEIMNSDKISELIQQKTYKGVSPNVKDFIYCLNGIPFFILKKDITLATGAIIALERWNLEINHHSHITGKLLLDNDDRSFKLANSPTNSFTSSLKSLFLIFKYEFTISSEQNKYLGFTLVFK